MFWYSQCIGWLMVLMGARWHALWSKCDMGGGDVHLSHVTFTLPIGRHPNRTIVWSSCCVHTTNFQQGETIRPLLVLRFLIGRYVSFSHSWIHSSYEIFSAQLYGFVLSWVLQLCGFRFEWEIDSSAYNCCEFIRVGGLPRW